MSSAVPAAGGSPHRRPWLPTWIVALFTFAVVVVGGDLATLRIVAPWLVRRADLAHLRQTLTLVTLALYSTTFLAATAGGAASARRGLRRGATVLGNHIGALFGALLLPTALLAYAIVGRLPVFQRPTVINFVLISVGALAGCQLVELVWGRRRAGGAGPGGPPTQPATWPALLSLSPTRWP